MELEMTDFAMATNKTNLKVESMIILGAGPTGLSAALYAARAELSPLVLTGMEMGGQASLTNVIENYPGFPDGIGGVELGEVFRKQAERFGARFEYDQVTSVDFSQQPFKVKTYSKEYLAETVIIATGASPNHLGLPNEAEMVGRGVSYCATCDGWFFKEKKVTVVGGGDSALEEALFLTRFATEVNIVHRRSELRAGPLLQRRAKENPKIKFIWNSVVTEIQGDSKVENLRLKNVQTGESSDLATEGLFIFVGHTPNTQIFADQVKMTPAGYIIVDDKMRTNVAGVFAAGEVMDPTYRQVVTSAGMGAAAAIMATKFLENNA